MLHLPTKYDFLNFKGSNCPIAPHRSGSAF